MSKTKPADEPNTAPAADEQPAAVDPRDEEIARLRAELAARPAAEPDSGDVARDATIAALRAQLDEIRSTPEGAAAELAKAMAALDAKVTAMAAGTGLVPVPARDKPEPISFGVLLECGDTAHAEHPNATHHHCDTHGTVGVWRHWELSPEMRAAANA